MIILKSSIVPELIRNGAFNEAGGLHHSTVIERSLVDHFVPFLPLEKSHVRACVRAEAELEQLRSVTDADVEEVMNQLVYWPRDVELYAEAGCKRIDKKVELLLEERYGEEFR